MKEVSQKLLAAQGVSEMWTKDPIVEELNKQIDKAQAITGHLVLAGKPKLALEYSHTFSSRSFLLVSFKCSIAVTNASAT